MRRTFPPSRFPASSHTPLAVLCALGGRSGGHTREGLGAVDCSETERASARAACPEIPELSACVAPLRTLVDLRNRVDGALGILALQQLARILRRGRVRTETLQVSQTTTNTRTALARARPKRMMDFIWLCDTLLAEETGVEICRDFLMNTAARPAGSRRLAGFAAAAAHSNRKRGRFALSCLT